MTKAREKVAGSILASRPAEGKVYLPTVPSRNYKSRGEMASLALPLQTHLREKTSTAREPRSHQEVFGKLATLSMVFRFDSRIHKIDAAALNRDTINEFVIDPIPFD